MSNQAYIPFCRPTIEDDEIASVVETLKSGWLTTGPRVAAFEQAFAQFVGAPHAVALNSATAGLHVALAAHGIGPGDEVITTSLTWPSAVNVIELLGARPVFADVHGETLQIDMECVRERMTDRTCAVVPVHFAGQPVDLDALEEVVAGTGVQIVEDAAHAVGTQYRGQHVGARRHPAVFSFHPIKNVTTGEGGMVTCHDAEFADRLRLLRFHGVSKNAWNRYGRSGSARYEVIEPGWKYNMLDLQAAIGSVQLGKVARFNEVRTRLAARYCAAFAEMDAIHPLDAVDVPHVHAWHLYIVRLAPGIDRDAFIAALADEGVGAGLHFTPVHQHAYYREKYGFQPGHLPQTEEVGERILSLPLYPTLSYEDQDRVIAAVRRLLSAGAARV